MYATCPNCHRGLGANETFETFPVGERIAFDATKGRLWVVCAHCERWNLTPLEERWEALEQAERLYHVTPTRAATENIGLARLRDGTTIVRIGAPPRSEFAAWRYGDQFGGRRTRQRVLTGVGLAGMGVLVASGVGVGLGVGLAAFAWMAARGVANVAQGSPHAVVARILTEDHGLIEVRRRHLGESTIDQTTDGALAINLRFRTGSARFEGGEAERVAAAVMPKVNRTGASKEQVSDAVEEIDQSGGAQAYVQAVAGESQRKSLLDRTLAGLPDVRSLALEMALHEDAERRALDGELWALEDSWRDAEEIAALSDSFHTPADVEAAIARMRGQHPGRSLN